MSAITPTLRRIQCLDMACETLLLAYAKADPKYGDHSKIDLEDIADAFEYAKEALPGRYDEIIKELNEGTEEMERSERDGLGDLERFHEAINKASP